jgi:hypothetical protein
MDGELDLRDLKAQLVADRELFIRSMAELDRPLRTILENQVQLAEMVTMFSIGLVRSRNDGMPNGLDAGYLECLDARKNAITVNTAIAHDRLKVLGQVLLEAQRGGQTQTGSPEPQGASDRGRSGGPDVPDDQEQPQ